MAEYEPRPPDIVKSVRQRWLFSYWSRLRAGRPLPQWSDLDLDELETCFDDLSILDVVPNGDVPRFRILTHGRNVGALYAGRCAGKYLDDVLPAATRSGTLETYAHVVRSRLPVYTVSKVLDGGGRPVFYERLLLPFSDSGDSVLRIVAFLETISPEGAFDRQELLANPKVASAFSIKAVLPADGGVSRTLRG